MRSPDSHDTGSDLTLNRSSVVAGALAAGLSMASGCYDSPDQGYEPPPAQTCPDRTSMRVSSRGHTIEGQVMRVTADVKANPACGDVGLALQLRMASSPARPPHEQVPPQDYIIGETRVRARDLFASGGAVCATVQGFIPDGTGVADLPISFCVIEEQDGETTADCRPIQVK